MIYNNIPQIQIFTTKVAVVTIINTNTGTQTCKLVTARGYAIWIKQPESTQRMNIATFSNHDR